MKQMTVQSHLFWRVLILAAVFLLTVLFIDTKMLNVYYIFHSLWNTWDIADSINEFRGSDSFISAIKNLERSNDISIEIFDTEGNLTYSTDYKGDYSEDILDSSLIRNFETVANTIPGTKSIHIERDKSEDVVLEYIVLTDELADGSPIKVYTPKTTIDESTRLAIRFTTILGVVLLCIGIIVIRLFASRFAAPLVKISNVTEKMSKLDFSERCADSSIMEISKLSDSINNMSQSLDSALKELRIKNKKLEEDIENERTIDHLRQNFISSISHELKTPIAIIQGYAEGLQMFVREDPDAAEEYSKIILEETGRMHDLVMKLLEIIKLQSGGYEVNYEPLPVYELVEEWFERNKNILSDKDISTENFIDKNLIGSGDGMLISSVVNNLLSNAVSHIDGEKIIRATATTTDDVIRVRIFNTGTPIADKDFDKIWNSFYRADKSMSRAEGRFGLGLTIVSSIQDLHGMNYGVENKPDGVEFYFDMKVQ